MSQNTTLKNCESSKKYIDDNDLDLALACEMSMLSKSLFLPQTNNENVLKTSNNLSKEQVEKTKEIFKKNEKPSLLLDDPPPGFSDLKNNFNYTLTPPGFSNKNENTTEKNIQEGNNVEINKKSWTESIMTSLFGITKNDN